jgi:molybdate/tungstate transport system substrate-binding protein
MKIVRILLGLVVGLAMVGCGGKIPSPQPTTPISPSASAVPVKATPTIPPSPTSQEKTPLVVFCAGSLIIPFADLEKAFESQYPNIDVQNECHGSIQVIRHVTELHEKIDVVATADASLIPMLMYASQDPESGKPYANWYIRFATNHLGIAYSPRSKYADVINSDNWYQILTRSDLKVGIADPRFDAAGYRAFMVFGLAQDFYQDYTLFNTMFKGHFVMPITIFADENLSTITIPEIVEARPDSSIVIRGASVFLIALIESGDLDYAFEYDSVIKQHKLSLLHLPDALNLGAEGFDQSYQKVQVNLDFRRFATVKPEFKGERIGYGITIPSNAPHPQAAAQFIAFLLGPEGRAIMEANFQPVFDPALADNYEAIPPELQTLVAAEP